MYEIIIKNLANIANEIGRSTLTFKVFGSVNLVFDMREEDFFWSNSEGDFIKSASQQSVVTVLGSQFGQQSSQ